MKKNIWLYYSENTYEFTAELHAVFHFAACLVYVEVTVGRTPWREHFCTSKTVKWLQIIGTAFMHQFLFSPIAFRWQL